jgi:hypothetical protein
MHMPAFSSLTRGRVVSSAGSIIRVGHTAEQIPQRVQVVSSTKMVMGGLFAFFFLFMYV